MGGDKQTTTMVLKVDLECQKCYKKIKKVLCKFPQIQDQVYDEKANTVTIKVVCCSPDYIKKKIIRKGGDSIKGIDIKPPPPSKPPPPEKPIPPEKPKAKEPDKPKPKEPEKPKDAPPKPKEPEKPKDPPPPKPQEPEKPKDPPPAEKPKAAPPPAAVGHPFVSSCPECYEGRPGGPCFHVWVPPGPPPCYQYDGYYGRPVYDSYGGARSYNVNRCDYFSEENTGACAIM